MINWLKSKWFVFAVSTTLLSIIFFQNCAKKSSNDEAPKTFSLSLETYGTYENKKYPTFEYCWIRTWEEDNTTLPYKGGPAKKLFLDCYNSIVVDKLSKTRPRFSVFVNDYSRPLRYTNVSFRLQYNYHNDKSLERDFLQQSIGSDCVVDFEKDGQGSFYCKGLKDGSDSQDVANGTFSFSL